MVVPTHIRVGAGPRFLRGLLLARLSCLSCFSAPRSQLSCPHLGEAFSEVVLCIRTSLAQTPSWAWVILCPWGHPVQRLGFYIPVPTPFPGLHPLDASTFPPAVTSKNIAEFAKCPLGRGERGLSHHPYRPLSTFEQNYTLNLFPGVPFTLWIPGAPLALETLVKKTQPAFSAIVTNVPS